MSVFDAHFHIIEPGYPLIENNGFIPDNYTIAQYMKEMNTLNLNPVGGAIVSGSFQGYDQTYLIDVLKQLPVSFVGVAQVPLTVSTDLLAQLNTSRVRAIRFNLYRGMNLETKKMSEIANFVYEKYGWHTEFYLDGSKLEEVMPLLETIPKFSIDHLGMDAMNEKLFHKLLEMDCYFKVSGFGRILHEPLPFMKKVMEKDDRRLLFGSDLPGTRARRKFEKKDIAVITEHFSKIEQRKILLENGKKLYNV